MEETLPIGATSHVLALEFDRPLPGVVRGEGVRVENSAGRRYLDAMSGGSLAATLGHSHRDIMEAARVEAERLAYGHSEQLPTSLEGSLRLLEADDQLVELLGREFVDVYMVMRRHELQRFADHVTDWELDEYLELY